MSFVKVPKRRWPSQRPGLTEVYISSEFLVQQLDEGDGVIRLSICRTAMDSSNGRWVDGISWDELQRIKSQVGFGDKCAVEVFPEDSNVVNVANMRHLFVLPDRPSFVWTSSRK